MLKFVLSIIMIFLSFPTLAQQSQTKSFAADLSVTKKDGHIVRAKFYSADGDTRIERSGKEGVFFVVIEKNYGNTLIYLSQQAKTYYTFDDRGKRQDHASFHNAESPCNGIRNVQCEYVGTELIGNRTTKQWVFRKKKNGFLLATRWIDESLDYPVRTLTPDGTVVELTDVKVGPLSADLFSIPTGYHSDKPKSAYPSAEELGYILGSNCRPDTGDYPSCSGWMDPNTSAPHDKE